MVVATLWGKATLISASPKMPVRMSPVMQPLRIYRSRAIMPGLGSFIFHTARAELYDAMGVDVWRSVVVRLRLDQTGCLEGVDLLPIQASRMDGKGGTPVPLKGEEAAAILARFGMSTPLQR